MQQVEWKKRVDVEAHRLKKWNKSLDSKGEGRGTKLFLSSILERSQLSSVKRKKGNSKSNHVLKTSNKYGESDTIMRKESPFPLKNNLFSRMLMIDLFDQ